VSKLVIFRGDAVETEMHLGGSAIRIGRDERNTIVLNDKSVSRFHAEVRQEGGTYYVVDLKSRNGIYVNGHQIKGKAALSLGVPVTLGAYELALEDDLSTSEFGGEPSHAAGHTVVSTSASERPGRPRQSATQRMAAAQASPSASAALVKRPAVFWSVLGGATLVVCLITFFAVRAIVRRPAAPPPEDTVAQQTTSIVPEAPASPNKDIIDQRLLTARDALGRREFDAVLTETAAVLELDPTNEEATDLKRQAEEGKAATAVTATKTIPKPVVPNDPQVAEVSGIPKRNTETQQEYDARVLRIKTNYPDGIRLADRQDYVGALAKFDLVKRDQPGYSEIDAVITETQAKQHKAVEDAVAQGQKSEQEGKPVDAKRWYERGRAYDPNAAAPRDRLAALQAGLTKQGLENFQLGEVYRKRGDTKKAAEYYRIAVDLLPNGTEKTEAQQWLEKFK
jgi:tetratricopeptide (TPR) repeat protein